MPPIATHAVAWSVLSVCLSVTVVNPAKTAEPIGIPFCLWPRVGPSNHVSDGRSGSLPGDGAILGVRIHGHARGRYIQLDDAAFYRITSISFSLFTTT